MPNREVEPIQKPFSVRIGNAYMKELLVIADQNAAVNVFGSCTPLVTPMGVETPEAGISNRKEEVVEGGVDNWGEVATR